MPRRLSQVEFTLMLALMFSTLAFSIDAMLPGLPEIAADLSPDAPNKAQLVLTAFVLGMGFGTLVSGPISDQFGRKPVILFGLGLYVIGAVISGLSHSLEMMLAGRVFQGFGAAFPRTVGGAMVRDLYEGRQMARVTSFVMTVFMIAPAAAPSIGALIIAGFGWHGVFAAFVLLALIVATWFGLRQDETLAVENRRPLNLRELAQGTRTVLGDYNVRIYTLVLMLGFGQMFAALSSIQQIYGETYQKADSFPLWFAASAAIAATAAMLNGTMVVKRGMHVMIRLGYSIALTVSLVALFLNITGLWAAFPVFFLWSSVMFFINGFTFGNLNALALLPMGRLAGLASSVIGALFTTGAVFIAAPVGLMFNGTPVPAMAAGAVCSALALLIFRMERPS